MKDLKQIVSDASDKELTRKQFLGVIGAGLVGVTGALGMLQDMSTPDLASSDTGAFGEREYGHSKDLEKDNQPEKKRKGLFG